MFITNYLKYITNKFLKAFIFTLYISLYNLYQKLMSTILIVFPYLLNNLSIFIKLIILYNINKTLL